MQDSSCRLTAGALDRLLEVLDSDRERAALAYEGLRDRTTGLLRWWGAIRADELADETLDRVARKLEEGTVIPPASLGAYVRGVARMVYYESRRRAAQQEPLMDEEVPAPAPAEDSGALDCLDDCLQSLSPDERSLVIRYYEGSRIEQRRSIAETLGISMTALRIRTHRLRERLERCVRGCLGDAAKRLPPSGHPVRSAM